MINKMMIALLFVLGFTSYARAQTVDLEIVDIVYSTADTGFKVYYRNNGTGTSTSQPTIFLSVVSMGGLFKAVPVPAAGTLTTAIVSVVGYPQPADKMAHISSRIDYYSIVPESSEDNNTFYKDVPMVDPATLPDLKVTDITYDSTVPGLKVSYLNSGGGSPSQSYYLLVKANGVWSTTLISGPAPGTSGSVVVPKATFGLVDGTTYQIDTHIDWYTYIPESNDMNNTFSKSVTLSGVNNLADLIVQSMVYNPINGNIEVTVKNIGNGSVSQNVTLRIDNNDTHYGYQDSYVAVPAPGATRTISVLARDYFNTVVGSTYSFTAEIDERETLLESNESNNILTKSLTIQSFSPTIDLIVDSITYDSVNSNVNVVIRNSGNTGSSQYMYVYVSANYKNQYTYIQPPGAASTKTISIPKSVFGMQDGGTYAVTAWADYYSAITESNESNNMLSKNVSLPLPSGKPDLIVTDVRVSYCYLYVYYKNIGASGSGSMKVSARTSDGYISTSPWYSVPLANGTGYYYTWMGYLGISSGVSKSVIASVDYGNYIIENNEYNNTMTKTVTGTCGP